MAGFYRASTPKFKMTPNLPVADLGTPTVILQQDLVFTELECTVDSETNSVVASLGYDDSLLYIPDVKAYLQVVWETDNGSIIPFPAHDLDVYQTHVEFEYEEEEAGATGETGATGATGETGSIGGE